MAAVERDDMGMTIEEYLRGSIVYPLEDAVIEAILSDRMVPTGAPVLLLPLRDKELCKADLYMVCALSPSITARQEDSDGQWKHNTGSVQSTPSDKRALRAAAREIYERYGEKGPSPYGLRCHGMRTWRVKR